jgi:hypothetical protein
MSMDLLWTGATISVPMLVIGTIAVLVVPGLVCAYRALLVRDRLDDIDASIWDEESVRLYIALFSKEETSATREELSRVIRKEFLSVHA